MAEGNRTNYDWARMGVAQSDVELFIFSDFPNWNMDFHQIMKRLIKILALYGIEPLYFKSTHMCTSKLFIVLQDLQDAYGTMRVLVEEAISGNIVLPKPVTVDWSHSQMTIFNAFYGFIPDETVSWG